jgi:hypothetical protein
LAFNFWRHHSLCIFSRADAAKKKLEEGALAIYGNYSIVPNPDSLPARQLGFQSLTWLPNQFAQSLKPLITGKKLSFRKKFQGSQTIFYELLGGHPEISQR